MQACKKHIEFKLVEKSACDTVLKLLGMLLLTAAVLKGWQLLTEPATNNGIWTNRAFLIFTVEFEIALGIWLLSGIFKKFAWLTTLECFLLFSFMTLHKGLSGAESCGCFGSVHVNPWITLFAVDIPSVIALAVFRLKNEKLFAQLSFCRFTTTALIALVALGATAPTLLFNKPAKSTSSYEVLEPKTWIGKELPILEFIDISKSLEKGAWVVLFYHHDCPDCTEVISRYVQTDHGLISNKPFLRIALIEVPPYGRSIANGYSPCNVGRLADVKDWFCPTPTVALLIQAKVQAVWSGKAVTNLDQIVRSVYFDKTGMS